MLHFVCHLVARGGYVVRLCSATSHPATPPGGIPTRVTIPPTRVSFAVGLRVALDLSLRLGL